MAKKKLLVSYDLIKTGKDYATVHAYLQSFPGWIRPLYSLYLVQTDSSAADVRNALKTRVDSDDKVLVIEITASDWATLNLPKAADWLK